MSSIDGNSEPTARSFGIDFWIYTGLVLGAFASVLANVAYTFIPPHVQPPWWPRSRLWDPAAYVPPPGDVAVAVFCPVAIFILTEVITRPRWREGKLSFTVRAVSAVMVGLPVAVASYLHLCSLLEYYSTIPVIAYTLPLTVDGLMLACTAALQLTGTQSTRSTGGPAFTDAVVALPHPRAALDDAEANPFTVEDQPGDDVASQWSALSTADATGGSTSPPVGPAPSTSGRPPGQVGQPFPPVGEAEHASSPPVDSTKDPLPPVGVLSSPVAPPVGLLRPPVGAVLLQLEPLRPGSSPPVTSEAAAGTGHDVPAPTDGPAPEPNMRNSPPTVGPRNVGVRLPTPPVGLLGPPVGTEHPTVNQPGPPVGSGFRAPVDTDPTGGAEQIAPGPTSKADQLAAKRPVPSGRLGAADLSDGEIIRLAVANNPLGKITGTALRKDFGVGPNRAARIRDEIRRRRVAARLAVQIHTEIARRRHAEES